MVKGSRLDSISAWRPFPALRRSPCQSVVCLAGCCLGHWTIPLNQNVVFQLGDIDPLCSLLTFGSSHGQDTKLELLHDESLISPDVIAAHGLCHSHALPVPLSYDDMVNRTPMHALWVNPRKSSYGQVGGMYCCWWQGRSQPTSWGSGGSHCCCIFQCHAVQWSLPKSDVLSRGKTNFSHCGTAARRPSSSA